MQSFLSNEDKKLKDFLLKVEKNLKEMNPEERNKKMVEIEGIFLKWKQQELEVLTSFCYKIEFISQFLNLNLNFYQHLNQLLLLSKRDVVHFQDVRRSQQKEELSVRNTGEKARKK